MIDGVVNFTRRLTNCRSNIKVFAVSLINCYPACNTICQSGNHTTNLADQVKTKLSNQLAADVAWITFSDSDSAPVPKFWNRTWVRNCLKFKNLTLVQSPATIDATEIEQCLFRTEAKTFVKSMQTLVTVKNKTDSSSGSGLTLARKTNAESCWNRFRIRSHLCQAVFRISNLQLKIM